MAEQAIELLAYVLQHPVSFRETRDRAEAVARLEGRLPPGLTSAAQEHDQSRDLEELAGTILKALETPLNS